MPLDEEALQQITDPHARAMIDRLKAALDEREATIVDLRAQLAQVETENARRGSLVVDSAYDDTATSNRGYQRRRYLRNHGQEWCHRAHDKGRPAKPLPPSFAALLTHYREIRGHSREQLARLLGISATYQRDLERGAKTPSPRLERQMIAVLELHGPPRFTFSDAAAAARGKRPCEGGPGVPLPEPVRREIEIWEWSRQSGAGSYMGNEAQESLMKIARDKADPDRGMALKALAVAAGAHKPGVLQFLITIACDEVDRHAPDAMEAIGLAAGGREPGRDHARRFLLEQLDRPPGDAVRLWAAKALGYALGAGDAPKVHELLRSIAFNIEDPLQALAIDLFGNASGGGDPGSEAATVVLYELACQEDRKTSALALDALRHKAELGDAEANRLRRTYGTRVHHGARLRELEEAMWRRLKPEPRRRTQRTSRKHRP